MYLTDFQKEIAKKISEEKIKTVKDFLLAFELIAYTDKPKSVKYVGDNIIIEGDSDFFFNEKHFRVKESITTYEKLIDFRKVVHLLSKAELIELENNANLDFGFIESEDRPKKIIDQIWSTKSYSIIAYNELKKFTKDFLTSQERHQKRQLWIPIIVAILTVFLSTFANYLIYSNQRNVYILNKNAFKDSLYVRTENVIDSVGKQNSNKFSTAKTNNDSLFLKKNNAHAK